MSFLAPRMRFWAALGLSIALHSLLGGGLYFSPQILSKKKSLPTSVELMSPEELQAFLQKANEAQPITQSKAQQIVSSDSRRLNDEKDSNAKYLSQFDQKVVRETRALRVGKTSNAGGKGLAAKAAPETLPASANLNNPSKSNAHADMGEVRSYDGGDFGFAPKTGLAAFKPSFRKLPSAQVLNTLSNESAGDGQEISSTDDHLKDIPTGLETMLSTREFLYYSYYNRIKDKLRQHWEPKIKEKFTKIMRQGRTIASEGDKITRLIIVLNEQGTLIRVQIVGRSGVTDLDDAAVEAFRAAAPFPNPPKGIVESDGTIKIRWDFVLEA
jgi:TonB family protein